MCVPLCDFVYRTHHTKDVDTDRRGLFTLSRTSTVSLQASIASLHAPAGVVHSEPSIPVATPPLQSVISPTPATTSKKTQSSTSKKAKSHSAPLESTSVSGLLGTTNNDVTLLSRVETASQVTQDSPMLAPQILESTESTQLVVVPAQLTTNPPQSVADPPLRNATESSQSRAVSESLDMATQSGVPITPTFPQSATYAPPTAAAKSVQGYRARDPVSVPPSHRGSIDGAPEIGLGLPVITGVPLHQDSVVDDTSEAIVDLSDFISVSGDTDEESHVSSSQKTSDGCRDLSPPPSSQWRRSTSRRELDSGRSRSPSVPAEIPYFDPADLPSWMTKDRQWSHIASTRGGPAWERLLELYMQQERRLEFRQIVSFPYMSFMDRVLNDSQGAKLTLEDRPSKISDYFRYAHDPLRGDDLTVPGFGEEVVAWWQAIQPDWRRAGKEPPHGPTTWSYILSGGSKGTFLIVMCLVWWHQAHLRYLESARGPRHTHAEASYFDLPDHDTKWSELVKDLTFVMEKAQSCDIPTPKEKRKREHEPVSSRKKVTKSRAKSKP